MTSVIIIDDEPLARSILLEYIGTHPEMKVAAECGDGFEGLKAIQQHNPALIFLDIQMPKINGFEMLELLDNPPAVIFTTAFDEYAIKAFEQNAVDYLLKPFSKERFEKAVEKFNANHGINPAAQLHTLTEQAGTSPTQQNRIVVKDGQKIKIIPVQKIHFLEAADDYVKIITADGKFLKKRTMAFYEESLGAHHFVRIHRSYIVNTQLITRIDPYEKGNHLVQLSTGEKLPVSKTGYGKLKEAMGL